MLIRDKLHGTVRDVPSRFGRVMVRLRRYEVASVEAAPQRAVIVSRDRHEIDLPVQAAALSPAVAAADLLARMDDLRFLSFRSEARAILGDDCPFTKDQIVVALRQVAG